MFLSVIIPVYNVENYISKCIESVISQQLNDEIELLLVDDGSKDSSGMICDEYASKFSWIKVFHTPNRGVASARNYGLERASGDFFTFIDSDDFIDEGIYTEIYRLYKKHDADAYVFGYKDYPIVKGSKSHKLDFKICNDEESLSQIYAEMKKDYLMFPVYNKVFRKQKCGNIRFDTTIWHFEDYIFSLECLLKVKTLISIDMISYNYVQHPGYRLGSIIISPSELFRIDTKVKDLSLKLPHNELLKEFIYIEYYNNILSAIDISKHINEKIKYISILLDKIKQHGYLKEFRKYLNKRRFLLICPNVIVVLFMVYIRSLILKIRKSYVF